MLTCTLKKGPHFWAFACEVEDVRAMLTRLGELARDETVPLDWFDVALVSHQLRAAAGIK